MSNPPPAASPDWAYFLDFDGTLVEIAATPDAVEVTAALRERITGLYRVTGGATALVTGRSLAAIEGLLAPARLAVAGLHGAEQRFAPESAVEYLVGDRPVDAATLAALDDLVARHPGVVVENKGRAIAIHYRGAPEAGRACQDLAESLALQDPEHWRLLSGKMLVEVKPKAVHKGHVVTRFMEREPFAGRLPVFIGDDVTDEDGFRVCQEMGGLAVRVGPPPEGWDTVASLCLDDPRSVLEWLAGAIEDRSDRKIGS